MRKRLVGLPGMQWLGDRCRILGDEEEHWKEHGCGFCLEVEELKELTFLRFFQV